jgi:predicted outer membrane repeat protein
LYNAATLTVTGCTLSGNAATLYGGGICNRGTLTVTGSTLSDNGATEGGGIENYAILTVTGSTLSGNSAGGGGGGIANGWPLHNAMLTVSGSTLSGNSARSDGGGILNDDGTVTVSGSTLLGNSAGHGGGIENYDVLMVINSTLSGNSANVTGGGIDSFLAGVTGPALTVSNCTLSGNSAGSSGGGIYTSGPSYPVTLTNVTLTANRANMGGGLSVGSSSPVLHNTLIAGNFSGATGTAPDDVHGALSPAGDYNLIGDGTGMSGLSTGINGNLVGSAAAPIDPLLGPLQNNGGRTQTVALLPGSPAINVGSNAYATATDRRGFARIVGGTIDIGAFEVQPAGQATHLRILAPASITAGTPFTITVTALDDSG